MQVRRTYVDGPFGQIHLRICGDGEPVLLMHQSPLSSVMFEPAMPYLARVGLRAIALDTPGYGLSDPPPTPPSLQSYATAPLAVLDALGLARAHVVGQHTGASIAASFAARWPRRLNRLVLNGAALLTDEERAQFSAMDLSPPPPRRDGGHLLDVWNTRAAMSTEGCDLGWMHRFTVETLLAGVRSDWALRAVLPYRLEDDLQAIEAPTLLLSADRDVLHPATLQARSLRPDWPLITLTGSQDIATEDPPAWSEAVAQFLRPFP